jgi:hypothetical protein
MAGYSGFAGAAHAMTATRENRRARGLYTMAYLVAHEIRPKPAAPNSN